jgi:DNA primase
VRQAVDIVDLVGSYVQLRRQGRNFVGLCPWHDDSRPSLHVNPDRQSFKCWVCDVGGDVFSFVMKAEGMEFREALEMLAERAGIPLSPPARQAGGVETSDAGGEKRTLYRVMAWAEEQFHRCLMSAAEGEPGRAYLVERGITSDSVRRFRVGFAPDRWDWLLERARGSEWSPALLERVGLLRRKELDGGHYDWFRGRVIFSIRDARSRPIAFGGRVLPQLADDHAAKYINSPETPLFSKSRELYGLDLARENFRDGGAIVMEGYTDCLMAHQHGINNAVAVLGTALGDRHLQLLRRHTDSITLVLDGDEAGRRRTNEILDALLALFEKNEVDLKILTLPQGVDPCDFIATQGSDAFRHLLKQAADALEHKFNAVTNGLDILRDTHRAARAAEEMLSTLAGIRPGGERADSSRAVLREQQMLSRIARKFHLAEEQLRTRLSALRRDAGRRGKSSRAVEQQSSSVEISSDNSCSAALPLCRSVTAWERDLLELVLADPTMLPRIALEIEPADFSSEIARRIYDACQRQHDDGGPFDFGRLLTDFDEPEVKNLLVELDESCAAKSTVDRERWWRDLSAAAQRRRDEQERRLALASAQQDPAEAERALDHFYQHSRTKNLSEYERRKK